MKISYETTGERLIDNLHTVFSCEDHETYKTIRESVQLFIEQKLGSRLASLETLHKHVDPSGVNSIRLGLFQYLNSGNFTWPDLVRSIAGKKIVSYVGPDYYLQSKINVSIQMPYDNSSVLPTHSDCVTGDSPWQLNLWIPLTRAFDTASMFIVSCEDSLNYLDKLVTSASQPDESLQHYEELIDKVNQFHRHYVEAREGELLIFHPAVLHGNEVNTTAITRISLNVRFKSIYTPGHLNHCADRRSSSYYRLASVSSHSVLSQRLDQLLRE
jgi:sporadic carbohydrate cluster 2OG-Fe(II) oxygenase